MLKSYLNKQERSNYIALAVMAYHCNELIETWTQHGSLTKQDAKDLTIPPYATAPASDVCPYYQEVPPHV